MEYRPLSNEEQVRHSNEAEDAEFLKQEHYWVNGKRDLTSLNPAYLLFYNVISTIIVFTLVGTIFVSRAHETHSNCPQGTTETVTFGSDFRFMSVDHMYDDVWSDWAFKEAGHDKQTAPISVGMVTMFHQLHCLAAFRHAIQLGHEGIDPGRDFMDDAHWPHCFDYMRKTILCWADDTIEMIPRVSNRTHMWTLDGSLDERRCRDSTNVVRIASEMGKTLFP